MTFNIKHKQLWKKYRKDQADALRAIHNAIIHPLVNTNKQRDDAIIFFGCVVLAVAIICIAKIAKADQHSDIAMLLAAEASEDGYAGMTAVASTILNRAKANGTTVYDEAIRPNQYYGMRSKNRFRLYSQVAPIADNIADDLLSGKLIDTVDGAKCFRTKKEPKFRWCNKYVKTVGRHLFYK